MFMLALKAIGGWFLSNGVGTITKQLELWQQRKAEAVRLGNQLAVKQAEFELARLEAIADNQIVDPPWVKKWRAFVRAAGFGFPVGLMVWKVLVNDMALQQCGTGKWIACTPEPGVFVMTIVVATLGWYLMFGRR